MMKRLAAHPSLVVLLLPVVAIGLIFALRAALPELTSATAPDAPRGAPGPTAPSLGWTLDATHRYDFEHRLSTRVDRAAATGQPGEALTGAHTVAGELTVTAVARDASGWTLAWVIDSIDRADARLMDRDVSDEARGLEGVRARAAIAPDGTLREMWIAEDATDWGREVLRSIVIEATVSSVDGARRWSRPRRGTFGEGPANTRVVSRAAPGTELARARTELTAQQLLNGSDATVEVDSSATITIAPEGHVARIESRETVRVGDDAEGTVALTLRHRGVDPTGVAFDAQGLSRVPLGGQATPRDAQLAARAAGLTVAQALDELTRYADAGRMPDHAAWFHRVTALLRLHPEACARFAEAALDPERTAAAQGVALDVLASVGHAEAQAAARAVLAGSRYAGEPVYGRLVQSLLALDAPDGESIALVESIYDGGEAGHRSAANVLGGMSAALRTAGDTAEARRLTRRLTDGLSDTGDEDTARAHLLALGNGRDPEAVDAIAARADDESPTVRRTVARALRRMPEDADAAPTLRALLDDDDPGVRASAVEALLTRGLATEDAGRLTDALREDRLGAAAARALVIAALDGRIAGDAARGVLEAAAASSALPARMRARAQVAARAG